MAAVKRDEYVRAGIVGRVIDGDTVVVDLDLGWDIYTRVPVRLAGINARELRDPGGPEARDYLSRVLPENTAITVRSLDRDKYGRALAVIYLGTRNINERLLDEGWAAPYDGTGRTSDHVPAWPRETT